MTKFLITQILSKRSIVFMIQAVTKPPAAAHECLPGKWSKVEEEMLVGTGNVLRESWEN